MAYSSQAGFSWVSHECAVKPRTAPPPNSPLLGMGKKKLQFKRVYTCIYMHKPSLGERLSVLMKTKFGMATF